jgi:hypothetical protein
MVLSARQQTGSVNVEDILRTRMELESTEAQTRAAAAEEKAAVASERAADATVRNAHYMLWSVIAAAVSAIASLASTSIVVFGHH